MRLVGWALLIVTLLWSDTPAGVEGRVKLATPGVNYRINQAAATTSPWVTTNGGLLLRDPHARYYYDVPAQAAALAAAEAYVYGADAVVNTTPDGADALRQMQDFLRNLPPADLPPLANIGYIDDGSAQSAEVMNLLVRRNLLFRRVSSPDEKLDLNVRIGSKEYPATEAANPSRFAQLVRADLTDDKRLLRIYGSQIVIGRLVGDGQHARLHLLSYATTGRGGPQSVRVRVRGRYSRQQVAAFGIPGEKLLDVQTDRDSTEFTVPEVRTYAAVDLWR